VKTRLMCVVAKTGEKKKPRKRKMKATEEGRVRGVQLNTSQEDDFRKEVLLFLALPRVVTSRNSRPRRKSAT